MKKKNRYDENMKEYLSSKTFKIKLALRILLASFFCISVIIFYLYMSYQITR